MSTALGVRSLLCWVVQGRHRAPSPGGGLLAPGGIGPLDVRKNEAARGSRTEWQKRINCSSRIARSEQSSTGGHMARDTSRTRVLISYSHDSEEHRQAIRRLADRLRQAGVDAWIDQFDEHDPPESWPDWMRREIDKSDVVIAVVTQSYVDRFNRETGPGIGSGVRWEGALITADLYHSRRERAKFIPVVLRAEDASLIPTPLNLTSWFVIGERADGDITRLAQVLLRDPGELPSELGIPSSSRGTSFHFDGIRSSPDVDSAFALSVEGDTIEAIRRLDGLLQSCYGDERAYILFLQGVLHHKIGEVTQAKACFDRVIETSGHPGLLESSIQRLEVLHAEFVAHFGEGVPSPLLRIG